MNAIGKTALLALLPLSIILGGCSSPAERAAITPQGIAIAKHHPYSIGVQASGGSETGAMDTTNIADADLKAAIEDTIATSKLGRSNARRIITREFFVGIVNGLILSTIMAGVQALSFSGRLRVSRATRPRCSTVIVS